MESFSSGSSSSWFNPLQDDTQESYAKTCTDMVLFCIGLTLGQFRHYSRPTEPAQRSAALDLLGAFHDDTGSGQDWQQEALQRFLLTLFTQSKRDGSRYTLTVFRFLILYSFRREGCLAKCGTITQYISRTVFIGRGTIFNEIKKAMTKDKQGYFSWVIQPYHPLAASSLFAHILGLSLPFVHISPSNRIMFCPASTSAGTYSRSSAETRSKTSIQILLTNSALSLLASPP